MNALFVFASVYADDYNCITIDSATMLNQFVVENVCNEPKKAIVRAQSGAVQQLCLPGRGRASLPVENVDSIQLVAEAECEL